MRLLAYRCGVCQEMAADWERLAMDYEDDEHVVIGEVDCTTVSWSNHVVLALFQSSLVTAKNFLFIATRV